MKGFADSATLRNGVVVLLVIFIAVSSWGQTSTATIFGTAADASGASIVGAQVTATNSATGVSRTVTSNDSGNYTIPFLPVGTYVLDAKKNGFQTFARNNVAVGVGASIRVDVVLKVGSVETAVNVSSELPQINTLDASVGHTVDNVEVQNLPLVNRDPYSFLTLTPGITSNTTNNALGYQQQVVAVNGASYDRLSGNLGGSLGFYLDGGFNNQGLRQTGNLAPNPDAVQEFRVTTNNYSAEFGHYSGGIVNLVTKSGTNSFHGSAFEFLRNDKLNATPWNVPNKPSLHRNQFGGTFGGPIVKNKAFFFFSYSGLRQKTTALPPKATVPTALERNGDFSQSSVKPINPATKATYPGNIVPLDPVAKAILDKYIPTANLPNNQYQAELPNPFDTNEFIGRVDYQISSAHQLSGSYFNTYGNNLEPISGAGGGNIPWSSRSFDWKQHNVTMNETWTISGNSVNQFVLNYVRNFGGRLNTPALSLADLGSKFNIQGPKSLPRITVSGYFTLGEAIAGPVAGSNYYGLRDVFATTRGRHSLKFGGEISLEKMVQNTTLDNYGTFTFDSSLTKNALGAFLAGLPTRMTEDAPINKIDNDWYYALFVQDDFRVRPNLTLNLGLRYDIQPPTLDPQDRKLTFVQGVQSKVVPTAPVGLQFVGDPGIERGIISTRLNHVAPRIGFAWDPFSKGRTSIRGGFGLFWNSISGNEWNQSADRLPFSVRQTFNNPKTLSDPFGNIAGGSPFPYVYDPNSPKFIFPAAVAGPDRNFQWPYTYQINFGVQQQITGTLSASATYVGALSHNLAFVQDVNYPVYTATATTSNVDARRPILPGTLSNIFLTRSIGKDLYHSLQLTVEKRVSHHFSLKGFYVWGKDIQSFGSSAQNMNILAEERGRSDQDIRHNFVLSAIWELSYLPNDNKLRYLLNGWTISTITSLKSGSPVTITTGADNNRDGQSTDRPNVVANPVLDHNRGRFVVANMWFNQAAFVANPVGTDGNASPNLLDGPGTKNIDLAIFRNIPVHENVRLQFRAEMTNAFNMVNLSDPNTSLSSPQFGKITSAKSMRQTQLGLRLVF
jgi:hypothetical protein